MKNVVLEAGGILENAAPGTLVVDMSSIAPNASKEMYTALKGKGMRMIDAPVSGGEPKAIDGTDCDYGLVATRRILRKPCPC